MTGEREPTPAYYRNPRRFIELTAHTTLPSPSDGQRSGTGKRGGSSNDKGSGTDKQREDEPEGIVEWHDIAARNR